MTEQPAAVVETPKRRIRIPLPTRATLKKVLAYTGVFTLGALVGAKRAKDACACEPDGDNTASTTDN
jgi:hypothetical protein